MKLACSSTAFDSLLRSGELTQLEWIDLCAHELAADGVVFDVRHFPRQDGDYLAQIKKMAADLGLSVAALRHDGFFSADDAQMASALDEAIALGAPLLSAPLPAETARGWSEVQQRLNAATGLAKARNVTLALRNAPETYAAASHQMKRVAKEADSAWLRFGPEFETLDGASDPESLLGKTVLVWRQVAAPAREDAPGARFPGFLALDSAGGECTPQEMKDALRRWRCASFEADRI